MRFRLKDHNTQHEEIVDVEEVKPETEELPAEKSDTEKNEPVEKTTSKSGDLSAEEISSLKEFVAEYLPLIKQMFGDVSDVAGDKDAGADKKDEGAKDDKKEEKPVDDVKDASSEEKAEEPKKPNDELTEDSCDSGNKTFGDSASCGAIRTAKVKDSIIDHEAEIAAAWQTHYNKYFNKGE